MKNPFFQLLILILSLYVICALVYELAFNVSQEIAELLFYIDNAICVIFLVDFISSFIKAESKVIYMKTGWIDLAASIPTIGFLRIGRTAKIIRIIRVIKATKSLDAFLSHVFKSKADSLFKSVLISSLLLIIPASISILNLEKNGGSIQSASEALWWTIYTLLGMDFCEPPVSVLGRTIAVILALAGMTILGSFTAYLADIFFKNKN